MSEVYFGGVIFVVNARENIRITKQQLNLIGYICNMTCNESDKIKHRYVTPNSARHTLIHRLTIENERLNLCNTINFFIFKSIIALKINM